MRSPTAPPLAWSPGVWTRDGGRQLRLARALRCGQVFINNYGAGGGVELPFGGVKRQRLRPREGLRGAVRLHRAEDHRHQARLNSSALTAAAASGAQRSPNVPFIHQESIACVLTTRSPSSPAPAVGLRRGHCQALRRGRRQGRCQRHQRARRRSGRGRHHRSRAARRCSAQRDVTQDRRREGAGRVRAAALRQAGHRWSTTPASRTATADDSTFREDEFDRIFAVNVKSIFLAARHAVPVIRRHRAAACFINIASTAGVRPRPGLTWYNGSKGAAITTRKSMAAELAPDNIRVNASIRWSTPTPAWPPSLPAAHWTMRAETNSWPRFRWAAFPPRLTWPMPRCTCPATKPPLSRACVLKLTARAAFKGHSRAPVASPSSRATA